MTQQQRFIEIFGESWYNQLKGYLHSNDFNIVGQKLIQRRKEIEVCPAQADIFKAFRKTPFDKVKVVLIGLHPYTSKEAATGLAFGVDLNVTNRLTNSIKEIHKGIESDMDILNINFDYTLEGLADQGVLLLNLALTSDAEDTKKHTALWKPLMDIVFNVLDTKKDVICINMDSIPENKIFSYINSYLYMLSKEEINWNIKDNE